MQNIEDLKIRIKIQEEIFFTLIANYDDDKFLHKPGTEDEKETIKRNNFLQRTKFNFWMVIIMDLCKLFSERKEKYCFHKFITQLEINYWDSAWKHSIPREVLKDLKKSVNSTKINTIIEKITRLRDKLYAHRDSNLEKHFANFRIILSELDTLIELGKKIIFEINKYFFDSHTLFSTGGLQKAKSLVYRIDNNK
ncbi:hypothetical protein ES705_43192 [subsurface metagenome]